MSQLHGRGLGHEEVSATGEASWQKPAAADDIVDPIDVGSGAIGDAHLNREQTEEEAEDVPLDVKITDALSMLADGGHDYGARPIVEEEPDNDLDADDDVIEIDESSKDA
jgi:hypothetical protein